MIINMTKAALLAAIMCRVGALITGDLALDSFMTCAQCVINNHCWCASQPNKVFMNTNNPEIGRC